MTATYYESIALALRDATGEKPSVSVVEDVERAPLGSKPAGAVTQETTLKAKVTAVDRKKQTVTLEGPRGGTVTLKVEDPKKLDGVAVGRLVEAVRCVLDGQVWLNEPMRDSLRQGPRGGHRSDGVGGLTAGA